MKKKHRVIQKHFLLKFNLLPKFFSIFFSILFTQFVFELRTNQSLTMRFSIIFIYILLNFIQTFSQFTTQPSTPSTTSKKLIGRLNTTTATTDASGNSIPGSTVEETTSTEMQSSPDEKMAESLSTSVTSPSEPSTGSSASETSLTETKSELTTSQSVITESTESQVASTAPSGSFVTTVATSGIQITTTSLGESQLTTTMPSTIETTPKPSYIPPYNCENVKTDVDNDLAVCCPIPHLTISADAYFKCLQICDSQNKPDDRCCMMTCCFSRIGVIVNQTLDISYLRYSLMSFFNGNVEWAEVISNSIDICYTRAFEQNIISNLTLDCGTIPFHAYRIIDCVYALNYENCPIMDWNVGGYDFCDGTEKYVEQCLEWP